MGPATVTLRSAQALEPPDPPETFDRPRVDDEDTPARIDYDERFAWDRRKPRRRAVAVCLCTRWSRCLILLLAGQALFHYPRRDRRAVPAAKPALVRACATVGCTIRRCATSR